MTGKHFHVSVVVTADEVQILQDEFADYVTNAGGFTLAILSDEEGVVPSEELEGVLRKMFLNLLATIAFSKFEGVH